MSEESIVETNLSPEMPVAEPMFKATHSETPAPEPKAPAVSKTTTPEISVSKDAETKEVELPVFQPNFKFKYFDAKENKQLEKEMDEWVRGAVKDPKTEKELRDLYEKAYGLDAAKQSRERARTEAETYKKEVGETKKALSVLSSYVQNGDMQSFFESLKIPEDKVLKYALDRLKYRDLPPEKMAEYDTMRSERARAEYLQGQVQTLEQKNIEFQATQRSNELNQNLSDPNVAQVVQAFDARMGAGAFQQEVIRRGQYYWHQFQQDIPVSQAIQEVIQLAGGMPSAPVMPMLPNPSGPSPVPESKPIIPHVPGSGGSPAKKRPRSVADLKRLGQAMTG